MHTHGTTHNHAHTLTHAHAHAHTQCTHHAHNVNTRAHTHADMHALCTSFIREHAAYLLQTHLTHALYVPSDPLIFVPFSWSG